MAEQPLGLVLAGGRSMRFGQEKALACVRGRPMIAAVLERLTGACADVAISAGPRSRAADWAAGQGLKVLADPAGYPSGPLAGVAAGLRWASGRGAAALITAPCDTPFLPQDLVARLRSAPETPVVMARTADGPQPMCALWRIEMLPALEAWLSDGRHGRVDAFAALTGLAEVMFDDAAAFANINLPSDIESAACDQPA